MLALIASWCCRIGFSVIPVMSLVLIILHVFVNNRFSHLFLLHLELFKFFINSWKGNSFNSNCFHLPPPAIWGPDGRWGRGERREERRVKQSEINVGWQKVDGERVLMGVWWTRPDRQWWNVTGGKTYCANTHAYTHSYFCTSTKQLPSSVTRNRKWFQFGTLTIIKAGYFCSHVMFTYKNSFKNTFQCNLLPISKWSSIFHTVHYYIEMLKFTFMKDLFIYYFI